MSISLVISSKKATKYVIDTSSLLVLVRYLLKLDRDGKLLKIIKGLFAQDTAVLHAAVQREIQRRPQAVVEAAKGFLPNEPSVGIQEMDRAHRQHMHDKWIHKERQFTDRQLQEYLLKADFQIIEHCRQMNASRSSTEYVVVTEEISQREEGNRSRPRPGKKIPDICASEGVRCINLMKMLQEIGIRAKFWQGRKSDKSNRSQR